MQVRYHGPVDLTRFQCSDITRSSFINRVCYARSERYMLINLEGVYYHYCALDAVTYRDLLNADSMGRYYNANIRSRGAQRGRFDCRDHPVPRF
ncbi:MAG: KTSC domain-containing protein [Bosea sp. (in: a-proteobacteria)]|nr:KTSC domain-containing protein [Bosea sp. (in: a-proteobacteria)]MDP3600956.1 KTSC domain-containing protein [Bosea sp. (in: a-proteobacteria)]